MIHYIVLKKWENFPTYEDLVAYVFDESFRKRKDLGFDYSYDRKTGDPNFIMLRWPKFKDNPNCPDHTSTSVVRVIFSPFNIPHSRIVKRKARIIGYPKIIKIETSAWSAPARIDHRLFYRTVFMFAKSTSGLIFENCKLKPITDTQYLQKHRNIINYPFHLKLTSKDVSRVSSNSY
jgi:hypothetical protein